MALMYNMNVSLAYIPKGKVIGLSKIVRIVDMVSKRLQLQERLTKDIGDIIMKSCSTDSVAVIVSGEHSCVTTRGIKKNGEKTVTTYFTGDFKNNNELRKEFLNSIGK
jgi:GTP cyclohydrolase I